MSNNIYVTGESYSIPTNQVRFDDKIAGFNQAKTQEDYDSLKMQIKEDGQISPIYMRDGLCGDGRHRVKICEELGIDVKCIDIDPSMDDEKYIRMCNTNIFGSRNDNANQRGIKAYRLVKQFNYTDKEAMELAGVKDAKVIYAIRYLVDNNYQWIIDRVLIDEAVSLESKDKTVSYTGKSIRAIKTAVCKIEEADGNIEIDSSEEIIIDIDYNEHIKTNTARDIFWKKFANMPMPKEDKLLICELLNLKYNPKRKSR